MQYREGTLGAALSGQYGDTQSGRHGQQGDSLGAGVEAFCQIAVGLRLSELVGHEGLHRVRCGQKWMRGQRLIGNGQDCVGGVGQVEDPAALISRHCLGQYGLHHLTRSAHGELEGEREGEPAVVEATAARLLGWVTGRTSGAEVAASGGSPSRRVPFPAALALIERTLRKRTLRKRTLRSRSVCHATTGGR
jgi:hypothetical protein